MDKMVGGLDIDLETQDKVAEEMLIGLLILIGKVLDLCLSVKHFLIVFYFRFRRDLSVNERNSCWFLRPQENERGNRQLLMTSFPSRLVSDRTTVH